MAKNVTISLTEKQAEETLRILRLWLALQTDRLYGEDSCVNQHVLKTLQAEAATEISEQAVCDLVEHAEAAAENMSRDLSYFRGEER